MDQSKAKEFVDTYIGKMQDYLWLLDWDIVVSYNRLEDNAAGTCKTNIEYKSCHITIDCTNVDHEKELFMVLLHELVHSVLGHFYVFQDAVIAHAGHDQYEQVAYAWKFANERTCTNLTQIFRDPLKKELGIAFTKEGDLTRLIDDREEK